MAFDPLSPDAGAICQGAMKVLSSFGFYSITEMTLANHRRADIAAMGQNGEIIIVEVKSSIADFRSDTKWPEYLPFCDRFFFAVSQSFPQDLIPKEVGLIVSDNFGGALLRDSPVSKLNAARRKAVSLRFARLAASRLMMLDQSALND